MSSSQNIRFLYMYHKIYVFCMCNIKSIIILCAGRVEKQFFFWGESPAEKKFRVPGGGESLKTQRQSLIFMIRVLKTFFLPLSCCWAVLPKRLGKFPFWRGEEDLLKVLEGIYKEASPSGMMIFLGERK